MANNDYSNKVEIDLDHRTIVGRVAKVGEFRYLPTGTPVIDVTLAVSDDKTDKDGKLVEKRTKWFKVAFWGKRAESLNENGTLAKVARMTVSGRTSPYLYLDNEGQPGLIDQFENFPDITFHWKGDGGGKGGPRNGSFDDGYDPLADFAGESTAPATPKGNGKGQPKDEDQPIF